MNSEDMKRQRALIQSNMANRLRAALLAEFAAMLKSNVTGEQLICEKDGKAVLGVAIPVISWTVLEGDAQSALEHVQTRGIAAQNAEPELGTANLPSLKPLYARAIH